MSCGFLCFHLCGSGVPVTTTCHCCAVVFLQSRRMRRSPAHLTVCKATAPDGAAVSALSAAALRPCFPADGLSGGYIHDHIPFQSSEGRDVPATKLFCRRRQKLLRLPPGQLPRDVVSVPPSERSTAGKSPKTRTAEGASLLREMTWLTRQS